MHAGIITTMVDSACGYAALSLMPPETGVLTIEFKVNLLLLMDNMNDRWWAISSSVFKWFAEQEKMHFSRDKRKNVEEGKRPSI